MRVSRRIRPSQVGCAASASRRRLQVASLIEQPDAPQARVLTRPTLVIQPDGQILPAETSLVSAPARPSYDDAAVTVVSTRG